MIFFFYLATRDETCSIDRYSFRSAIQQVHLILNPRMAYWFGYVTNLTVYRDRLNRKRSFTKDVAGDQQCSAVTGVIGGVEVDNARTEVVSPAA
jgi:hypothetical protein